MKEKMKKTGNYLAVVLKTVIVTPIMVAKIAVDATVLMILAMFCALVRDRDGLTRALSGLYDKQD